MCPFTLGPERGPAESRCARGSAGTGAGGEVQRRGARSDESDKVSWGLELGNPTLLLKAT